MQERAHMQLHNWLTTFKEGILKSQSQSLQDSRVRHQELKDDYLRLVFLLLTMACCEHCWPYKTAGSFSITKMHASRIHSFSLVPTWPFPMRTNSLYPLRFSIFCTCKLPTTEEWQRPSSKEQGLAKTITLSQFVIALDLHSQNCLILWKHISLPINQLSSNENHTLYFKLADTLQRCI